MLKSRPYFKTCQQPSDHPEEAQKLAAEGCQNSSCEKSNFHDASRDRYGVGLVELLISVFAFLKSLVSLHLQFAEFFSLLFDYLCEMLLNFLDRSQPS